MVNLEASQLIQVSGGHAGAIRVRLVADVISEPSAADWTWLEQAEQEAQRILRLHYGEVELQRDIPDLALAQRLLDDHLIAPQEESALQYVGVVLGNVFEANTSMRWVRVRNEFGEMLALHSYSVGFTFYPLSMVADRAREDRHVDVRALYKSFVTDLHL